MTQSNELTTSQRHLLSVVLGTVPAILAGWYIGLDASGIGSNHNIDSILHRAGLFIAPVGTLAFFCPRYWVFPSLVYGLCFFLGYTFNEALGTPVRGLVTLGFSLFSGHLVDVWPPPSTHPELFWFYALALWLAIFLSFMRRQYWRDILLSE